MSKSPTWSRGFLYTIHQTNFLIEKRLVERLAKERRISFSQFVVLMGLACCAKRSQADIAEHLFLTQATVSRHVRTLIANGLLVKKINPRSKRECILTITLKGRKEMARARDIVEQEMKNIVAPIRSADRMLLLNVFRSLLTTLQPLNQKLK